MRKCLPGHLHFVAGKLHEQHDLALLAGQLLWKACLLLLQPVLLVAVLQAYCLILWALSSYCLLNY